MSALIHSIWTIVLFIVFLAIVAWAYSGRRKKDFDEASRLALDDEKANSDKRNSED